MLITGVRKHSLKLLEKNDLKACWAVLDRLFPQNFFYRLGITAPYSDGKENQATNFKGLTQAIIRRDHLSSILNI
jgi:hypothetical protein